MHTTGTLTGTLQNLLNPSHRTLHLEDERAIVTLLTHIRALWTTVPPKMPLRDITLDISQNFPQSQDPDDESRLEEANPWSIARDYALNAQRDGYVGLARNMSGDLDNFRRGIVKICSPVFVDVMNCLPGVQCSVGHLNDGVGHYAIAMPFNQRGGTIGKEGREGKVVKVLRKAWGCNIVMFPIFAASGCEVRVSVICDEQDTGESDKNNNH